MGRHANPDIRRAFAEFQDETTPSKCNKVRCLYCGFVRAKNTTRQIEHLQDCRAYLDSPDSQVHLPEHNGNNNGSNGSVSGTPQHAAQGTPGILNGQHPNPNLQVHRRGPNQKRNRDGQLLAPHHQMHQAPQQPAPSLSAHLLSRYSDDFRRATEQPFLSHAGCGTLQPGPLQQWMAQDSHYSRGYIRFVGQLLAKIRLPQGANTQFHPMYRTMDLLISALNNMRREMQFFEITATKFGLAQTNDRPTPITRAMLDLFVSASSPSASLLEGMLVLWGTEHVSRSAWQYASSFTATLSTPSNEGHIVALHQALIPNWTSHAFSKFVDATRSLVDELANSEKSRDGKEEMARCEEIFRQICWLEERFWPDVDGMGEEDDSARLAPANIASMAQGIDGGISPGGMNAGMNAGMNGSAMNNQGMNPSGIRPSGTPGRDNGGAFGGLENVGQPS